MKTLLIRAGSALIGAAFVGLLVYFGGVDGMRFLGLIAVLLGTREGMRILFPQQDLPPLKIVFSFLTVFLFVFGVYQFDLVSIAYGVAVIIFFSLSLFYHKKFTDLEALSRFQARSILGFFYLALLPTFACKLLDLSNGLLWFLALLIFVFAGDTFAYLVGSRLGKHLLMPAISPKKSLEGSLGGLIGSCLAGFVFHFLIPHVPALAMIGLAFVVGLIGQMGDLFESMLKRVANQKDSGSLMPGHGGALDRIDGVLFAAPLMLAGASLLEKWF